MQHTAQEKVDKTHRCERARAVKRITKKSFLFSYSSEEVNTRGGEKRDENKFKSSHIETPYHHVNISVTGDNRMQREEVEVEQQRQQKWKLPKISFSSLVLYK